MKIHILLRDRMMAGLDRDLCQAAYEAFCQAKQDPASLEKLRRIEHERWIRFYTYNNWTHGQTRSGQLREDPMICRYEELTEEQKAYHDWAWELLGEIAKQL